MTLPLNEKEQQLLDLLFTIPPSFKEARAYLEQAELPPESITKVAIDYADECFCDIETVIRTHEDNSFSLKGVMPPAGVIPGLHSAHVYDVVKLLLEFGLNPNMIINDGHSRYTLMGAIKFIDNEYMAADTMALLLEHGGNPNLIVDGESVFEQLDFEIWFGSVEQYMRWRYDSLVHIWMVLVAYGGEITGKGPMVKTFKGYDSDDLFDLSKLRNHRDFYFGLSIENHERALHVYDKKTLCKVAQW